MTAVAARSVETAVTVGAESFLADVSGALWWQASRTLIVSDLHLEKGSSFAARGFLLPPYDTGATLSALARVIQRFRPDRVIALGDSFHDGAGPGRMAPADRELLSSLQRGLAWLWIAGNHDEALAGRLPGDHAAMIEEGGISLLHEPRPGAATPEIAGHLHPCARAQGRGRALRRRAFATDGRRLVMPAFGAYCGGLNVRDAAFAGLFPDGFSALVLGEDRVYALPRGHCLPD